ncbi:MAG: LacI family DNA-binding transcriptional regulator [Sporolactobacillus sp.]
MAITIKDIAKEAGVSIATVSRVINHTGGYSPATEKKVTDLLKQFNYRANRLARGLVKNQNRVLGALVTNALSNFSGDLINGIEDQAYHNGYSVILTHTGLADESRLLDAIQTMAERRVDGVLIISIQFSDQARRTLLDLNLPTVSLSIQVPHTQIPFFKVDDYKATFAATEYLIQAGHRQIGFAGVNPKDPATGLPRLEGYLSAMSTHHIPVQPVWIQGGDFSFASGQKALIAYIQADMPVSAVLCASDDAAAGMLSSAYTHHIAIPDKLSVMGFDHSFISQITTPPLTTVEQPFYKMAALGTQALIEHLEHSRPIASQLLRHQIVEGGSVKRLI